MGKTLNLSEHRSFLPDEMGLFCFVVSMQETPLLRRSAKRQAEGFAYDFVVVEVVLHALDDLIILMALACQNDHITHFRQFNSGLSTCQAWKFVRKLFQFTAIAPTNSDILLLHIASGQYTAQNRAAHIAYTKKTELQHIDQTFFCMI